MDVIETKITSISKQRDMNTNMIINKEAKLAALYKYGYFIEENIISNEEAEGLMRLIEVEDLIYTNIFLDARKEVMDPFRLQAEFSKAAPSYKQLRRSRNCIEFVI